MKFNILATEIMNQCVILTILTTYYVLILLRWMLINMIMNEKICPLHVRKIVLTTWVRVFEHLLLGNLYLVCMYVHVCATIIIKLSCGDPSFSLYIHSLNNFPSIHPFCSLIHSYVTGFSKRDLVPQNNIRQMLAYNRSLFGHFVKEANKIWYPGRAIIMLLRYQI